MVWSILCGILVLLGVLWLLSLRGQRGDCSALQGAVYAHRGLHSDTCPENSLSAFRAAAAHGFGAELDVHLLADGSLAVMHDRSLLRTAGADVDITTLTRETLSAYTLLGSGEPIPLLEEVLAVFEHTAPLIIELKADGGNHAALCEAISAALDRYDGAFCLESFDPRCLWWLRRHRSHWIRGQLSQNFFRSKDVSVPLRGLLTSLVTNALTRPHFIAYRADHKRCLPYVLCRRLWKLHGASWTLNTKEQLAAAVADKEWPIFEGFIPHET